jgi:NAD(P)-dependent dehydrogenase (short-subunit alcohol dehydrogenase family)
MKGPSQGGYQIRPTNGGRAQEAGLAVSKATLQGRVVLVTGGSSGIGRAAAIRLAGCGARLALLARTLEPLQQAVQEVREMGADALAVTADVTDPTQCRRALKETVAHFGRVDVLICSAGISMRSLLESSDLATLEQVVRVNFFGTLYPTYFAIPHVKRTRGSLIAVSSLTGRRGIPSYATYSASKFAVQGLYQSLRLELRADGVHVGVVSPGFVNTPLRHRVLGPDGQPWQTAPPHPFRVWPVEKCVDCIMRVLLKRRREALLPWFVGPLLALEQAVGEWLGDLYLGRKFRKNAELFADYQGKRNP